MDELNEMRPCRRQQKPREKKGSGSKQVESGKQTRQRRKEVHPGQVDRESRCVRLGWRFSMAMLR